jgi:hypothetical protein
MYEKEYNNVFKFSLTQGNVLLCEKIFDADNYNPFTRYSIDIRDILPKAITRLQKTLSKRNYDVLVEVGQDESGSEMIIDLNDHYEKMINWFPELWRNDLRYNPQLIIQQIEQKTIRGVPCKMGLYINENPIVEREFFVDGFNPIAKNSIDLIEVVVDITDNISNKIKKNDIKNMWDDYDLINYLGLTINQIRELTSYKRDELLRRIRK